MTNILKKYFFNSWLWALLLFIGLLGLYIRTLMPGTVGGDAGELQYAGPILALTHPTGLPLYIFVGHLWSKVVVVGTVAYRMNLLAAVSGALGSAILLWMTYRLYNRWIIAILAGLTCGLGATFWGQAVLADKYAFNTIFVSAVVGLALWWARDHEKPYADRLLYVLSAVYGISLLHHRTMLLFAFCLGFLVLYHERWAIWENKRRTIVCLGLVLLPALITYPLFLPWIQSRNLAPSEWQPQTVGQWIEWLMDRHEAKEAFVVPGIMEQLENYTNTMLHDYTIIVVAIGALGAVQLARQDLGAGFFVIFTYLLQGGLAANWRDNDRPFTYFLPSFILLVYAYAHGLNILWNWAEQRLTFSFARQKLILSSAVGIVGALVIALQWNYAYPIRARDADYGYPLGIWRTTIKTGDMGERLASGMDDLPPNAVLLTEWEPATILWYYQKVEGIRPDITIKYPVERYLPIYEATGRPLCISHHVRVNELSERIYHPTAYDALICLQDQPTIINSLDELPPRVIRLGKSLSTPEGIPQLMLAGYWVDEATYEQGSYQPLVLSWWALDDLDVDYSISVRVYREDWTQIWQNDIQHPVSGMYPTSQWVKNELVHDYHELAIPPEMPVGNYFWAVIVYRQLPDGTILNLRHETDGEVIFGSTFQVVE